MAEESVAYVHVGDVFSLQYVSTSAELPRKHRAAFACARPKKLQRRLLPLDWLHKLRALQSLSRKTRTPVQSLRGFVRPGRGTTRLQDLSASVTLQRNASRTTPLLREGLRLVVSSSEGSTMFNPCPLHLAAFLPELAWLKAPDSWDSDQEEKTGRKRPDVSGSRRYAHLQCAACVVHPGVYSDTGQL